MKLVRLDVRRLPGLETPFALEPAPELTIVQGTNGSGKSSVCRAILGLLFPDGQVHPGSEVRAVFRRGDRELGGSREGTAATLWPEQGPPVDPPLPAGPLVGAYRLGMLDLHHREADENLDDRALVQEVRQRLAGGFDVESLLESADLRVPLKTVVLDGWKQAHALVDEARARQRDLARDEDERLPELARELAACEEAMGQLRALRLARQIQTTTRRRAAAEARLRDLPAAVARVVGNELDRLREIERRLAGERTVVDEATAGLAQARRELAACGFADGPPERTRLAEARTLLETARDAARELASRRDELVTAEAALAERAAQLGPAQAIDRGRPVTVDDLREAERLLRQAAGAAVRSEELARLLTRPEFADIPGRPSAAPVRDGLRSLLAWLAAPRGGDAPATVLAWLAAACGLATGVILFFADRIGLASLALAGTGLALAAALRLHACRRATAAARRDRQTEYAASGHEPPAAWDAPAVVDRASTLADLGADERHATLRRRWRDELAGERDRARQERREALAGRDRLAAAAGAEGATEPIDLVEFLRRVGAYHDARAAAAAANARVHAADERHRRAFDAAVAILTAYAVAPTDSLAALGATLADLEQRADTARRALAAIDAEQRRLADATGRRDVAAAELADLYRAFGLDVGDRAALASLVARRDDHRRACADREAAIEQQAANEAEIAGLDPALGDRAREAAAGAADALQRAIDAAEQQTVARDRLLERKGGIERRLADARAGLEFEAAKAALDQAEESGRARREQARRNALVRLLLQDVADEYRSATLPGVLERARSLFATFTRGAWQLAARRDGTLYARDTAALRDHALDELSDGTRAQLLLAARLAFIEDLERGDPLPLLLDEALTAADPQRFAAIAAAITDLVAAGRQVIVLTADPGVVGAWQELRARRGSVAARVLDLDRIRNQAALPPAAIRRPLAAETLPDPALPAAAYRERLQVPRLDVHATEAAAHLWYLLQDDPRTLDALLRVGPRTWGALVSLAAALRRSRALDAATHDRLQARARALRAFLDERRVGRGLPVTRDVLAGVPRIGQKAAELGELADRCGGDAGRLLAAVEGTQKIAGLGERMLQNLREHLVAAGCLDERPPASRETVLARVLDAAAGAIPAVELAQLVDHWWQASAPPLRPATAES